MLHGVLKIVNKGENSYRCVSNENNYRDSRKVKCDSKRSVNRSSLEEIVCHLPRTKGEASM